LDWRGEDRPRNRRCLPPLLARARAADVLATPRALPAGALARPPPPGAPQAHPPAAGNAPDGAPPAPFRTSAIATHELEQFRLTSFLRPHAVFPQDQSSAAVHRCRDRQPGV